MRINTERFFPSVAMFCYGFQHNLRGPAWAVGSYSISPPADGTFQNFIFQTLRQMGRNVLYRVTNIFGSARTFKLKRKLPYFHYFVKMDNWRWEVEGGSAQNALLRHDLTWKFSLFFGRTPTRCQLSLLPHLRPENGGRSGQSRRGSLRTSIPSIQRSVLYHTVPYTDLSWWLMSQSTALKRNQ